MNDEININNRRKFWSCQARLGVNYGLTEMLKKTSKDREVLDFDYCVAAEINLHSYRTPDEIFALGVSPPRRCRLTLSI